MSPMPTVLRQNGFAVKIPVDDHLPPHVHVRKARAELVVNLGEGLTPPSPRENRGMTTAEKSNALQIVRQHRDRLLTEWRKIHG